MTATNHALTGAAIGLIVGQPLVALPLALVSHYICDAIPHFGAGQKAIGSPAFKKYLIAEAAICFLIVLALFTLQPQHWLLAAVCAFVAAAPDLLSINRFRAAQQGKSFRPNRYSRWAHSIQWFERPIGLVVEAAWAVAVIVLLWPFLKG